MADSSRQLSRFAAIFAGGTMASRVLGLARDVIWLRLIPSGSLDAFLVAFKLPNMLRDLIGEGASNAAFIPTFSESLERDSDEAFRELVSAVMSAMLVMLAVLTVVGVIAAPLLLQGLGSLERITGAEPPSTASIARMMTLARWTFPYLFFIGMTVFAMAPLFAVRHYVTPSWSPALLNVAIIACCLGLRNHNWFAAEPAWALVVGVWLGGMAQLAAQYIALGKCTGVWRPNFKLGHPGIRAVFVLWVPVLLGQATGEVNKLVDLLFAASLEEGTVKVLFHANRLVQLPLSVFGMAVAAAVLPAVSRAGARGELGEIRVTLMRGLRQSFFLILPALFGLMLLHRPIVRLLFERGEFTPADTTRTGTALCYYTAGLLSFAWVKVSVSGFYAVRDTKTPVIVASVSMFVNILLNCVLVRSLGYRGLALATTISFTLNFALIYVLLCNRFGPLWDGAFLSTLSRIALAALMMSAVAYGVLVKTAQTFGGETFGGRLAQVGLPVAAAVVTYAVLCAIMKVEELNDFFAAVRPRKNG